MSKILREAGRTLAEATQSETAGLLEVEFITPGWGSSGYYSPAVVEAAVPLFTAGTQMFFDHASATERTDRPERSVRDLAAVLESDAYLNPATGGIRGLVKPLKAYEALLTDETFAKNVGLSISGSASDITVGEAEGRKGPIIESLAHLQSVDFVTKAGRGGRVLAVMESAGIDVAEATAGDRREQLRSTLRSAYPNQWTYLRDVDAERPVMWFEVEPVDGGPSVTYEQAYAVAANDVDVTLVGSPIEVRRLTTYVPVTRPGGTTTEESQEDTMPNIQIEESEHARLVQEAGRVTTLENERDTALAEAATARRELAAANAVSRARTLLSENEARRAAGVEFTPLEERGLLAGLALSESGELDEAAFTSSVDAAVVEAAKVRGSGAVTGFGRSAAGDSTVTESDIAAAVASAWGDRQVKEA